MDKTHLAPFLATLHAKDPAGLDDHMKNDVTLRNPILADPVIGEEAVRKVLAALLPTVDDITVTDIVECGQTANAAVLGPIKPSPSGGREDAATLDSPVRDGCEIWRSGWKNARGARRTNEWPQREQEHWQFQSGDFKRISDRC